MHPAKEFARFQEFAAFFARGRCWCTREIRGYCCSEFDFLYSVSTHVVRIIFSAVVLSIVYQYLLGHVDIGGTQTYNPGSIEFRDIYVSLVLFLGAYVWIKFRDVDQGVRRLPKRDKFNKARKDEFGQIQYYNKWEARFKLPRERGYLHLGSYDKEEHAVLVRQIGGYLCGKDEGVVALEDGTPFHIPVMSEQERNFCGEEKRKWVSSKAKAIFNEIQVKNKEIQENASRRPPSEDQVHAGGCSSSADPSALAPLAPASTDGDDEFLTDLSTLAAESGPLMSNNEGTSDYLTLEKIFDVPLLTDEMVNRELDTQKERLEAEHAKGIAEERLKSQRLEEVILELLQENKRLKTILEQAANPLRAFFLSSTVELGHSTENC